MCLQLSMSACGLWYLVGYAAPSLKKKQSCNGDTLSVGHPEDVHSKRFICVLPVMYPKVRVQVRLGSGVNGING